MVETRDEKTGITRHEYGTVNPEKCRECIDGSEYITRKFQSNNVTRYTAEVNGAPVEIYSTPTRTIFFSLNRYALTEIIKTMKPDEWVYENEDKNDFVPKSQGGA